MMCLMRSKPGGALSPGVAMLLMGSFGAFDKSTFVVGNDCPLELSFGALPSLFRRPGTQFKYPLVHVVAGQCVVRYDNERDKGDHRHFGNKQRAYGFTSPDQLRGGLVVTSRLCMAT
jgi:hypothetical protein